MPHFIRYFLHACSIRAVCRGYVRGAAQASRQQLSFALSNPNATPAPTGHPCANRLLPVLLLLCCKEADHSTTRESPCQRLNRSFRFTTCNSTSANQSCASLAAALPQQHLHIPAHNVSTAFETMQTALHTSRCPVGVASLQSASRSTRRTLRAQRPFVCSAQQPRKDEPRSAASKLLLPATAALAAALLVSAGTPDQALAARSGGRVGGSSFRSARPAPAAPRG